MLCHIWIFHLAIQEINERLTVGAKVKLLFGLAQQKMHYDKLIVEASEDRWIIDAQGESITTLGGLDAGNNIGDELDFDKFEVDAPGIAGFGMGIDLGGRSEERRVGKECTSWWSARWSPYH